MTIERETVRESIGTPAPPWMSSFADIITQVVVFFVMLLAFSVPKKHQQLQEVKKQVEEIVKIEGLEEVKTKLEPEKGLVITLKEKVLFDLGKAELSVEAKKTLDHLYPIFVKIPNLVVVEGHTDNIPIVTAQFPSNWELSAARATRVVRWFIEEKNFPQERIAASGYGEYHSIASNDTPEGRAQNRRVDFVIEPLGERQKTAEGKLLLLGTKELK